MEPITVTVEDACKALGIKRTKLYELLSAPGGLCAIKVGRRTLIKTDSIREFVANCEAA